MLTSRAQVSSSSPYTSPKSFQGIPPPADDIDSFSSFFSSSPSSDIESPYQLSQIKDINKELRKTATIAIKNFKSTSKNYLSLSRHESCSGSILINELEHMRKNLSDAASVYRTRSRNELIRAQGHIDSSELSSALIKIQEIQKNIEEATIKLKDSENLITKAEESDKELEERLKKIEDSMHNAITEGPEQSSNEHCTCSLY